MSELSISSRDRQLREQKQAEDLRRQNEERLENLHADYSKREDSIREAGDAAISHIRKTTDARVERNRDSAQDRLERENAAINKNYSDLKKRSSQQISSLETQVNEAEERSQENIARVKQSEARSLQNSQAKLRDFVERQGQLRQREETKLNTDLESARRKAGDAVKKMQTETRTEMDHLEADHRTETDEFRARHRAELEATRTSATQRLEELRGRNAENYERELRQNSSAMNHMKDAYRRAETETREENARELGKLESSQRQKILETRDHATKINEKSLSDYTREGQRVQTEGEKKVAGRQQKFETLLAQQEKENDDQLKETETQLRDKEEALKVEHETHLQTNAAKLKETLKNQNKDFRKAFDTNEKMQKESLEMQKQNYLKALHKQGSRFEGALASDAARSGDPFYNTKTFNAKLSERPDGFSVSAKVPEYDRDTVEVKVQPDRITLSARRAYENTLDDGNERTQTSAHQTYRQEFKLDVPVVADRAMTTIEKNGTISVFAPKKGYGTKKI